MNKAVLIVGYGPYGYSLAKQFESLGYYIIMVVIKVNSHNQIPCKEFHQIEVENLYEENCINIYKNCINILNEQNLQLEYIIHTARFSHYEFNSEYELPDVIKKEMYKVNAESPVIIAKLFYQTDCKFVFTSSGASMGFSKKLSDKATLKSGKKRIGTKGLKHYSYVKRVGEEKLYEFFKENNKLDSLIIIYIAAMHGTNFFIDMNVTNITTKALNSEQISNNIIRDLLKGRKRIYADSNAKFFNFLPCFLVAFLLNNLPERLYPLTDICKKSDT